MPREIIQTFRVAGLLCVICSVFVSATAVVLRPFETANKALEQKKNVLLAAGIYEDGMDVDAVFKDRVTQRLLDLEENRLVTDDDVDFSIEDYDSRLAAADPERSIALEGDPLSGIRQRERFVFIYEVSDPESKSIDQLVLPIYGNGLWSTLYGFVAIDASFRSETDKRPVIRGLTYYEHGETPGLGGEVDNPRWKEMWPGKQIYDQDWNVLVEVIKGQVSEGQPSAVYQVDGLTGATITSRGVTNMLKYWLGEEGFRPYLVAMQGN